MRAGWACTALLAVTAAGCTAEEDPLAAALTIENASSYTLVEIQLSPVDSVSWGPDLLGNDVLEPGDALEISNIACDSYDIRVADELGGECYLSAIDLCLDESHWTITDADLIDCELGS
jgi:hypothetical protein